ncbi:hypothetical protein ONS95_008371 [Cadophora gregata]|uniref:uncharacterized protein n=1 Tax=Cadophora gregata TaxID=51156 RepID=UPI0026DB427F|nr:uncharacterized protein ONS95_008371 [Cadophora gregata]KAK0126791.1 hypothetical protein ONS95_008371 [Cadophora gregata]
MPQPRYPRYSYIVQNVSHHPLRDFLFLSATVSLLAFRMKFSYLLPALLALSSHALPSPPAENVELQTRADASLVGYLGVFFLGSAPNVYFYLSNGNNAFSYKALKGGSPILDPSLGTGGVRDPSIVSGGGSEAGKKWYIIGTDLDIGKTTWDAAQRKGSLSIYIWESTDLINWGTERLVKVENNDAGMVWAPDAIWDSSRGQYLVHWASKFYSSSDSSHTGTPGPDIIRYAYTSDFRTFSSPQTLISAGKTSIIDLAYVQLGSNSYARFLKNESATNVYMERSDTGLFGTWTRPGGGTTFIHSQVEGPYAWKDNAIEGRVNLLLDCKLIHICPACLGFGSEEEFSVDGRAKADSMQTLEAMGTDHSQAQI